MKKIFKLILIFIVIFIASMTIGYTLSNKIFLTPSQKPKYDYKENIEMAYIEEDNISYKGDYIFIDDNKLEFVLNFSFSEDVSSFEGVSLSEFTIEDENGNLIYEDVDISDRRSIAYSIESSGIEVNKSIIKQFYRFKLKEKVNSKKIIFNFKKLTLYNVNKGNPITKEFAGNWKLELNV